MKTMLASEWGVVRMSALVFNHVKKAAIAPLWVSTPEGLLVFTCSVTDVGKTRG